MAQNPAKQPPVKWGNPDTSSFEKHSLRIAVWGDTQVRVHRHVWPLVERLFTSLEAAGVPVAEAAPLDDPLKRGFRLPGVDQELMDALLMGTEFKYDGTDVTWSGDAGAAAALSQLVLESAPDPEPEPEPEPGPAVAAPEPLEQRPAPISRDLDDPEVRDFMERLFGGTEPVEAALRHLQARMGTEVTDEGEEFTQDIWRLILPQRTKWLRPGATGQEIKVLQAAFLVRGYLDPDLRVDGKWGVEFSRALRRFQADYGIFGRMRVGNPDWEALFGDTHPPGVEPG